MYNMVTSTRTGFTHHQVRGKISVKRPLSTYFTRIRFVCKNPVVIYFPMRIPTGVDYFSTNIIVDNPWNFPQISYEFLTVSSSHFLHISVVFFATDFQRFSHYNFPTDFSRISHIFQLLFFTHIRDFLATDFQRFSHYNFSHKFLTKFPTVSSRNFLHISMIFLPQFSNDFPLQFLSQISHEIFDSFQ